MRQAAAASPGDAGLAYALAQILLEAGLPAVREFETAVKLAPGRGDMRLGLAAARLAAGQGPQALTELGATLAASPGWIEGHRQYAQLASLVGRHGDMLATLERAIAAHPTVVELHQTAVQLLLDAERFADARDAAQRGRRVADDDIALLLGEAAGSDELRDFAEARALFNRIGPSAERAILVRRSRHFLRTGSHARAAAELEPHLGPYGADDLWPYAALAWRIGGDPRATWLDEQPGLISVTDLEFDEAAREALAGVLGALHDRSGRFLDQSVRGGSQTDGALFARVDPEIVGLRERIRAAVAAHITGLPPPDPRHPTLARRRDRPIRFAGSWSVRLRDAGFHAAHHHPQGWLSSAFYVSVPQGEGGMLELGGAPADFGLDLAPRRVVEPRVGRLVMFPSWMWHATRPFSRGERMTVAFDIART
ncbi:2OG-Fe(II) oxygenase family protein [Novosphingobium tardum]|uniref:2OG-Fe(II) oxygenase family protein n=1 Tax=Novosphingobium tardum TaxID=1538021 RepID=A0ABV8RKR3_9SPHN